MRWPYALNAESGVEATVETSSNAFILDLGLSDIDGVSLCRTIRPFSSAPIIVLSATPDEEMKIRALDIGCG